MRQSSLTTVTGVKSYAGYIHLPPGTLADTGITQNYDINASPFLVAATTADSSTDVLLVLRIAEGSHQCTSGHMDERWPWLIVYDRLTLGEWTVFREQRLEFDIIESIFFQ